jgi:S-DNA-T family DNA segregation ATPase FtsK/SpoIIIE
MSTEKKNKFRGVDNTGPLVESVEDIEKNDIADLSKKGSEKKNKPRNSPKAAERKKETVTNTVSYSQRWQQLIAFYRNERTGKITGLLLILFSAYLSISFVSYFFSWEIDQDKVLGNTGDLFLPETRVANWLGK